MKNLLIILMGFLLTACSNEESKSKYIIAVNDVVLICSRLAIYSPGFVLQDCVTAVSNEKVYDIMGATNFMKLEE